MRHCFKTMLRYSGEVSIKNKVYFYLLLAYTALHTLSFFLLPFSLY